MHQSSVVLILAASGDSTKLVAFGYQLFNKFIAVYKLASVKLCFAHS